MKVATLPAGSRPGRAGGRRASRWPGSGSRETSHVVEPFSTGVLFAAVDGLGHGDEAALAARAAVDLLRPHAGDGRDLARAALPRGPAGHPRGGHEPGLVRRAGTARFAWLGVGNVEGVLVRADPDADRPRESLVLRGGVVGYRLPALRADGARRRARRHPRLRDGRRRQRLRLRGDRGPRSRSASRTGSSASGARRRTTPSCWWRGSRRGDP